MHKLLTWFLLFPFFAAVAAPPPKNFVNDGNFARGGAGWHYFDARGGEFLSSGGPQGQPCFKLGGTDYDNIIYLTAVPYIFEIVIFVLLFELALIVFLNYPFPVFPFR